jgi:hypothetical protein
MIVNRCVQAERKLMKREILVKMKKGVYYPGNHLGKRKELDNMVTAGFLERMQGSFFCGPDNEPSYCLTAKGCREKRKNEP